MAKSKMFRVITCAALLVCAHSGGGSAQTQAPVELSQPLVLPGEVFFPLRDGCGVAVTAPVLATEEQMRQWRQGTTHYYSNFSWRGECRYGVAHGAGQLTNYVEHKIYSVEQTEFVRGAKIGPSRETSAFLNSRGAANRTIRWLGLVDGEMRSVHISSWTELPTVESLAKPTDFAILQQSGLYTGVHPENSYYCEFDKEIRAIIRNCRGEVHGIRLIRGDSRTFHPCPNPRRATGCERVWNEVSAPYQSTARRIIASIEAALPQFRQERLDRYAAYLPKALEEERSRRVAKAEAAALAAREREREHREFRASLSTLNAGQLFNRADELENNGDKARATEARRALIERFPDSPLAGTAAQQLAGTAGSAAVIRSPRPTTSVAAAARRQRSCTAYLTEYMPALTSAAISQDYEFGVFIHLEYLRLAEAISVCRNDQSEMASLRRSLENGRNSCRSNGFSRCQTGNDPRSASARQSGQREFDRIVAEANGAQQQAAAPPPLNQCTRTPDQELAAFNSDMERLRSLNPIPGGGGARDQYVWMASFAAESLKRLEPRRVCLGRHYEANRSTLVNARNAAVDGCEATSTSRGEAARAACIRAMR
jgi:hypothetical protein